MSLARSQIVLGKHFFYVSFDGFEGRSLRRKKALRGKYRLFTLIALCNETTKNKTEVRCNNYWNPETYSQSHTFTVVGGRGAARNPTWFSFEKDT